MIRQGEQDTPSLRACLANRFKSYSSVVHGQGSGLSRGYMALFKMPSATGAPGSQLAESSYAGVVLQVEGSEGPFEGEGIRYS